MPLIRLIKSIGFLCLFFPLFMQGQATITLTENDSTGKKEVRIIYSDLLENEVDSLGNRITKLSGGVQLAQDSVLMFCDTAFKKGDDVIAYGNVAIQQNDTLMVFSDSLVYRGESKIADLFGNVVMENGGKNLFTNYLNYELEPKIARYVTGALITQKNTKLVSKRGTYYINSDEMYFKDSITVFDSTFTLRADTLLFNTETQVVTFLGPTLIHQDSNLIYCEDGFYDIETQFAEFTQQAQYVKGEQKATAQTIIYDGSMKEIRLEGDARFKENDKLATADIIRYEEDSEDIFLEGQAYFRDSVQEIKSEKNIIYNSLTESFLTTGRSKVVDEQQILEANQLDFNDQEGTGLATGNVFWQDTVENISIESEIATYLKTSDYIKASGGRPMLTSLVDKDTLFLASDTLVAHQASETDSSRIMQAYRDVRIFKKNLQAVADSLSFISKDSLFKLYKDPVLWSDTSQFKGDSIFIQMKGGSIDQIFLYNNAFVITSPDLQFFNQIKGKNITAFFVENELDRVKVEGNAESIYYALDENDAYIGVTKTVCSEMLLFFEDSNVRNIKFYKQPNSDVTPMHQVLDNPPSLDGFSWDYKIRPRNKKNLRDSSFSTKRSRNTPRQTNPAVPQGERPAATPIPESRDGKPPVFSRGNRGE